MPEYTNNKESSRVNKIMVLASVLANQWLFSSSFLICLTQNISKQFRVTDKYKRKNLPQIRWRNLLQNARTGARNSSSKEFPLRKHCLLVMRDPDYPACTVFAKGLISLIVLPRLPLTTVLLKLQKYKDSRPLYTFQMLWWRDNAQNFSQHTLYSVQHIHINLKLIHCTLFRCVAKTNSLLAFCRLSKVRKNQATTANTAKYVLSAISFCQIICLHAWSRQVSRW